MNNNNNFDISQMMNMLSKMDKKELEAGIAKANQILQTKSKDKRFAKQIKIDCF